MSRIGKVPVPLEKGVSAKWNDPFIEFKGPKGELKVEIKLPITVDIEENQVVFNRPDDTSHSKSFQGLYRSLCMNAATGVINGYEKKLEIIGVGYKAEVEGKILKISVGFAFAKDFPIPEGLTISVDKNIVSVQGIDKQLVGEAAARIRAHRPPEPYNGKGIRYVGEYVKRKAGKSGVGGAG